MNLIFGQILVIMGIVLISQTLLVNCEYKDFEVYERSDSELGPKPPPRDLKILSEAEEGRRDFRIRPLDTQPNEAAGGKSDSPRSGRRAILGRTGRWGIGGERQYLIGPWYVEQYWAIKAFILINFKTFSTTEPISYIIMYTNK